MFQNMLGTSANTFDDSNIFDVAGNQLRLIYHAAQRLEALLDLIKGAQHSLKLYYYMFEEDDIGELVRDSLVAAVKRGVETQLIVDSFGSNGASKEFFDVFRRAGGKFAIFSPRFSTSYFVRNHKKMAIADDCKAIIGGFNIADQYFDKHPDDKHEDHNETGWLDIGLIIEGPEIKKLAEYYLSLSQWVHDRNGNIRMLRKLVRSWQSREGQNQDVFRLLIGGPSNRLSHWAWSIKKDLEAGSQLDLVMAYFSPGQGLLRRIRALSKGGGCSRLLLAGKTDNGATIGASRSLYGYLLKRRAQIFEYEPKRLHAKMIIVDNAVYLGSANFDLRSLFINVEIMLRIEDTRFAEHARCMASELREQATEITPPLHRSRKTWLNRARWALSYMVVNLVDYSVTRRFNFGLKK